MAVAGASGAGKSTLCRTINGLIPKFVRGDLRGRVRILGEEIGEKRVADVARHVGLVFQDFEAQLFCTNVTLEVAFGPENLGLPRGEIEQRLREALELVDLKGFERRDPATLSGGQKQRLAIASILTMAPDILILDEPTTDLDPMGKQDLFRLFERLRARGGTVLMVEHETEGMVLSDRLVVMDEGKIVSEGEAGEILRRTALLEGYGVRPLEAVALFEKIGMEDRPLRWEEAYETLQRGGRSLDEGKRIAIAQRDRARTDRIGEPVVVVEDLDYVYEEGTRALLGVSLRIRRGEMIAIVGQNGCGKTTLVKHFNRLLLPTSGRVRVFGRDTREWRISELGRKVGYVFQNPDHQIFADTVGEEVAFGPRNFGFADEEVAVRVREALHAVDLTGREADDPFSMTKGERQRIAVAAVLAVRPEVIVLDEPTTGLDYRQQRSMLDLVRRLNEQGMTVVMVTHAMWVVAQYARRCIVMQEGTILFDGTVRTGFAQEELLAQAHLEPPDSVRIGNRLGWTTLSPDELAFVLDDA